MVAHRPRYQRLTPALRAQHVATLAVLGHGVASAAVSPLLWRKFFVVTACVESRT
jgi:hypothetical protein